MLFHGTSTDRDLQGAERKPAPTGVNEITLHWIQSRTDQDENGCWNWLGTTKDGYARAAIPRKAGVFVQGAPEGLRD